MCVTVSLLSFCLSLFWLFKEKGQIIFMAAGQVFVFVFLFLFSSVIVIVFGRRLMCCVT